MWRDLNLITLLFCNVSFVAIYSKIKDDGMIKKIFLEFFKYSFTIHSIPPPPMLPREFNFAVQNGDFNLEKSAQRLSSVK